MPTTTPLQGLPVPVSADNPDVPGHLMSLAQAIESRLVMTFPNAGSRDSAIPTPSMGMMCFLVATGEYQVRGSTTWETLHTVGSPSISYRPVIGYANPGGRNSVVSPPVGSLGANVTDGSLSCVDGGGSWRSAAASSVVSFGTQVYGGAGVPTGPGGSSISVVVKISTSEPNTYVDMVGKCRYVVMASSGYQEVTSYLLVQPPTGGEMRISEGKIRAVNASGNNPNEQTHVIPYECVVPGEYTFRINVVNGLGSGNANNLGGVIIVRRCIRSNAF